MADQKKPSIRYAIPPLNISIVGQRWMQEFPKRGMTKVLSFQGNYIASECLVNTTKFFLWKVYK